MKSTLPGIAVGVLLLGLAGCGSPDEPGDQQAPAPATTAAKGTTGGAAEPAEIGIADFEFNLPTSVAPGADSR